LFLYAGIDLRDRERLFLEVTVLLLKNFFLRKLTPPQRPRATETPLQAG